MAKVIFRANAKFDTATIGGGIAGTVQCQIDTLFPTGIIKANFGQGLVGIPTGTMVVGNIVNGVLVDHDGADGIPLMAKNADVSVSGVLNYKAVIDLPKFETKVTATFPAPTDATPVNILNYVDAIGVLPTTGLLTVPVESILDLSELMRDLLVNGDTELSALNILGAADNTEMLSLLSIKASLSGAETLSSKRLIPRTTTIGSSPNPEIDTNSTDRFSITNLTTPISSMSTNLTGSPQHGEHLEVSFKDDGTARSITWGSNFTGALLATTVANKTHVQQLVYDANVGKWAGVLVDTAGY